MEKQKFVVCVRLTGEALTQSSLLEADGESADSMVTMTTTVEPMNLHHAMLRSPGRHLNAYDRRRSMRKGQNNNTSDNAVALQ